ncbi:MAG TPA: nitrilase-related carbon-nitrogen hydrolase [Anaerolineales bacterium]|nr:nitrilase-related carbon-nitrogen hydrolase [Anaerolineales bacterium]
MTDLHLEEVVEFGKDSSRGNLLGIEPYINIADYVSAEALQAKLDGYMSEARQRGWLNAKTMILLPEYLGTWLVLAAEPEFLVRTDKLAVAEQRLVLQHISGFLWQLMTAREKGKLEAAVFRLKAETMAETYDTVLSSLAKDYHVTVIGGSTILPMPRVSEGRLIAGKGPLYGVTPVYGPDGCAHPNLVLKAHPTTEELPFMTPASPEDLPAFDTPAGKVGVLICADSWFPDCYARLDDLGVDLIAIPSNGGDPLAWDQPWGGYSGWPTPIDVDANDVGKLTEGEAWRKYALAARIHATRARFGSNVFIRGQLLDMAGGGGRTTIVKNGEVLRDKITTGASLVNLWL